RLALTALGRRGRRGRWSFCFGSHGTFVPSASGGSRLPALGAPRPNVACPCAAPPRAPRLRRFETKPEGSRAEHGALGIESAPSSSVIPYKPWAGVFPWRCE